MRSLKQEGLAGLWLRWHCDVERKQIWNYSSEKGISRLWKWTCHWEGFKNYKEQKRLKKKLFLQELSF